jgi:hypothetical protein
MDIDYLSRSLVKCEIWETVYLLEQFKRQTNIRSRHPDNGKLKSFSLLEKYENGPYDPLSVRGVTDPALPIDFLNRQSTHDVMTCATPYR